MPDRAWRLSRLLHTMSPLAGRLLGLGSVGLAGHVPSGQSLIVKPQRIWYVTEATATLHETAFGNLGPHRAGDAGRLRYPQRGVSRLDWTSVLLLRS